MQGRIEVAILDGMATKLSEFHSTQRRKAIALKVEPRRHPPRVVPDFLTRVKSSDLT
jgi:hypothetical protein